jgi:D-glycero-alpha-D-manno-heptose-7-phosphate kinase
MIVVRSPVRISFGGGGTDLPAYFEKYGGAVLSASINKYGYVVINERSDTHIQIISSDLRVFRHWNCVEEVNQQANRGELVIPLSVLKQMGGVGGVDIFIASEILPSTGLGSSASICVSLVHAVAAHHGMALSKYDLAATAVSIGSSALGSSVGKQDEFASAFGGLNLFKFNADGSTCIEPVTLPP